MPPVTSPPSTPPRRRHPSPASPSEAFWPIHHSAEPSPPETPVRGARVAAQWMPPTPISLHKSSTAGSVFNTAGSVGEDDKLSRGRSEAVVIDLTTTNDDEDVQEMGVGNGEKDHLAFVLWWDGNLVGVYCPFCLHLETHLASSIATDSSAEVRCRPANCDGSKVYRILYPYDDHPATKGCGEKCDERGHHETTGFGDILQPVNDRRDEDGFIDISEWEGDIAGLGEGLKREAEDDIQDAARTERSLKRSESLSPAPIASSDTEDDDLGFLSDSEDEDENRAGRSEIDNESSKDDESIIIVKNGGRLPKVLHFKQRKQSLITVFSEEDRAPSALISEALTALSRRDSTPRVGYEGDGQGMEMNDRNREDDDSNGIAEIAAASEWADRHEPSIAASTNISSSFANPTSVAKATSPPDIPPKVSPYLTLRPANLKGRTVLYGYMANIPSEGAYSKTIGISTIVASSSSTPGSASPFTPNNITITRSGYHRTTSDDPRILNNIHATAAVQTLCAESDFPLKADNMDNSFGIGQVYCSHVEKQLIVHAVQKFREQQSSDSGVGEQNHTAEQQAADEVVTQWTIFVDRAPCDHCHQFREAVEARFPLKFTFTTIPRAEIPETEKNEKNKKKKKSAEKPLKTRANCRLSINEESSILPPPVPRTPQEPAQQMARRDSGYGSATDEQVDRSTSRKRRASSPCEMARRRVKIRNRGLVMEEWEKEFAATLMEDESEDVESADGDDEVRRMYEIRRRRYE